MEKSSVLDRVKLFLPEIKKANEELVSKITKEGANSVIIDATIVTVTDATDDSNLEPTTTDQPIVKLEFCLGDFDNTPIAIAEEEKDDDNEFGTKYEIKQI